MWKAEISIVVLRLALQRTCNPREELRRLLVVAPPRTSFLPAAHAAKRRICASFPSRNSLLVAGERRRRVGGDQVGVKRRRLEGTAFDLRLRDRRGSRPVQNFGERSSSPSAMNAVLAALYSRRRRPTSTSLYHKIHLASSPSSSRSLRPHRRRRATSRCPSSRRRSSTTSRRAARCRRSSSTSRTCSRRAAAPSPSARPSCRCGRSTASTARSGAAACRARTAAAPSAAWSAGTR